MSGHWVGRHVPVHTCDLPKYSPGSDLVPTHNGKRWVCDECGKGHTLNGHTVRTADQKVIGYFWTDVR